MFSKIHKTLQRFVMASAVGGPVLFAVPVGGCNPFADLINQATELAQAAQTSPLDTSTYLPTYTGGGYPQTTLYDPTDTIQSAYEYRQEVYDNSNQAWDEYIRQ